ncbi:MAG: DMT family transporter [bacterium]|jgi:drug/metabolite transporter (DMT)-like permease
MKGIIIILAILSASIEPIIVKIGYNKFNNINPFELIVVKNLVSFLIFCVITFFYYFINKEFKILEFKDILSISRVSFLLLFTTSMSIISLKYIPAIIMLTIYTTTPLFVALTNFLIKKTESLNSKFFIGFLLAFLGVTLTIGLYDIIFNLDNKINFLGIIFAFLGVLSSTIYRTTLDYLTNKYSPFVVSNYIFLINGFIILFFIFPFVFKDLKLGSVLVGFYGGISGTIANIAFLYALSILGSTKVSLFNMLNQPTVILLSALILKEKLSVYQILGIFLTILGINIARKNK